MGRFNPISIPVDETGESTRLVRWSVFVLVVFFGGAVAWGAMAPISGAVVAGGVIKIDTNRKSVQHFEGGIIRSILVREGDQVTAGQALLELEDTDKSADLNILTDMLNGLQAKDARLQAEASLADGITFPDHLLGDGVSDDVRALVRNEQALFEAKRKTLFDQIELINTEIVHAEEVVKNLEGQIKTTRGGLSIVREQLANAEKLVEKRAIDKNSILELKRKVSDQNESLWAQRADLAEAQQTVAALRLRVVTLRNDYSKVAEDELKENRQQIVETRERMRPVQDAMQRRTIRAPIGGQVINLQATTIGGVVRPGDTIAEIVPEERDLVFEVRIRPQDVDAVFVGQAAKVQLTAFSARSTPMIDAALTYVSGDALVDDAAGNQEPFFLAHVESTPEALEPLGDRRLAPGMPVTAFVQTSPRTFFDYVLSPLTAGMRKSLVEDVH